MKFSTTPFSFTKFLRNYGVFGVIADIVFYCAHRSLHQIPWLYRNIHKRHHEHYTTNLTTNFHFTALDLFLESALPLIAGIGFLDPLWESRWDVTRFISCLPTWHGTRPELIWANPYPQYLPILPSPSCTLHSRIGIETRSNFTKYITIGRHPYHGIRQWIDYLMGSRMLKSTPME